MQSQPDSQSDTVTTAAPELDTQAQPAECEPSAQEEEHTSAAAAAETEAVVDERETVVPAEETPASMAVEATAQSQTESSENTVMMKVDTAAKPDAPTKLVPDTNTKSCSDGQKAKKQGKADGRKYVPSKKAMVDPLKIDMSKPLIIPLTSSQLSLQCMECHIIFRDHKSKERHLKLNHPAEYEQCILRNALFACYVCDRHFTNSAELMTHQKAHKEKKPFKCPICDLAFKKSSELTSHKKIHFGQDGYPCTDCGKTCKTLTLLKYHLRTHTGERPYVCKECGKRFTMSKTLQKHMMGHLSEGAEGDLEDITVKARPKKNDSATTTKYPCSVCKAIFKSSRTRLRHIKSKHNMLPAAACSALSARQQEKQCTPIITPISICQPGLLQVEPDGPLQKVDANIDTEQICRLIESMGNIQKVNQVVILGQVPPDAPPLEVQQISQLVEPVNLNVSPPQIDFLGLKQVETKAVEFDPSMEQTIILEPITPDGQLENPSFSELGSHIATGESIELTLVPAEHTETAEGEEMQQILQQPDMNAVHSDPMDQMVCQNEVDEQTVILELTPALIPTAELEQSVPQNEIPPSTLVINAELETPGQTAAQTVADEQESSLSVPPFMSTVELALTPLQPEQQDISSCSLVPPDTLTQTPGESETNPAEDALVQTMRIDQIPSVVEGEKQETAEQEPTEKSHVDSKNTLTEVEDQTTKEEVPSQTNQVPQISEIPVNVMSAQELVKVRKRKPARAFFFQGYMQDLVGSVYRDDFQIDAKPAKRQRKNKSHLVVKFGPQSKEKKNKKQKKSPQQRQPMQEKVITMATDVSEKKAPSQKKGRKGKKDKMVRNVLSADEKQSSSAQVSQVQQVTVDKSKNKGKKQKEAAKGGVTRIGEHKTVASPMFKKKKQAKMLQKDQPKNVKAGQAKKSPKKHEQVEKADIPASRVTQDSLLLLKGHKQPQLKVYKLDPSKASAKALDASPNESQTATDLGNNKMLTSEPSEVTDGPKADGKKKGGRPKKNQKALSLLSSLKVSHQQRETPPTKPKTTRKRKASSKVETEGVITSKRALKCKDCGENFSEVSSLQKHKATVHIVESPSLTYTNGNIFEGVSRLDLYQLPKGHDKVVAEMNAATDWDTEPEMALEDRERNVSFPALIPSPSLPNPASDVDISACEEKGVSKRGSDNESHTSPEIHSPSDEIKNGETLPNFTSESFLSTSTQTRGFEAGEPLASDEPKQGEDTAKNPSSESEGKCDEDIKEDLLLEVDLVTVGEQNERDGPVSHEETVTQTESNESADKHHEETDNEPPEKGLTSQTVSCSTHQVEIKEEEEDMLVQKKKDGGMAAAKKNATRSKRRAAGHQKRDARLRRGSVGGTESEKEQDECQVVYEEHPVTSDSEVVDHESGTKTLQSETRSNKHTAPVTAPNPPTLEESSEGQVVLELAAVSTRVEEVMNETCQQGGEEEDRNQSPGIILEKFLTSRQGDKEPCQITARDNQRQGLHSIAQNDVQVVNSQEIKDEENSSDPQQVAPACENLQSASTQPQNHRDIRTVLVKEESSLVLSDAQAPHGNKHIRWNVEPVSSDNAVITLMENEDTTTECCVTPEFNTNQCIFYPVKEEEREVLVGAAETTRGSLVTEGPSDTNLTELQSRECNIYERSPSPPEYHQTRVRGLLSEPGLSDISDGQDSRWQSPSDLREFLLQSSDEEDAGGFELSDPQFDSEADVMAYFYRNQTNSAQQPNLPTLLRNSHASTEENRTRKPIDYFSKYFGWDTWVDITSCTNKLSNPKNLVTAREVACFVGIHIAMGTLKFPSPKLYWEDLTKVSLIADAMPLSRFLELSRMLKLTSTKDPASSQRERTCDSPIRRQPDNRNDSSQTDPLWKVQPILCRFRAGCQTLRREGDYAVDQYPIPLTGKKHSSQPSLHCTTLIGFGGLVLHVDLKLDLSDKEGAVEKMVPKGSMVFLCKQELSTPAMLERLLAAGVHGAGRVGGARGQIGDEFVSSDGKLMLRRSHCGFILSTAGNCQSNMASLIDNFEKAQMSARLNRDLQNLYPIPLTASVPTCWPQAVLWYLTDLALVNSWLLYRQCHAAPLTLMAFRLEVSKALILSSSSDTQDSVPPQPPTEKTHTKNGAPNPALVEESPLPDAATRYDGSGHWPEQLGEGEGGRCRFGDCQRTSRVLCLKCCVFLCISRNHNCFLNFHNQGSSEKE